MSRALVIIRGKDDRERAARWVMQMPPGGRVEFKAPKRTLDQNSKLWASLTDVATQKEHCGRRYTADQWKILFLHAIGREVQFIPSLDGSTFIPWGQSSSDLSKDEMSTLIDFIECWCAENGVALHDPKNGATFNDRQAQELAPT
jgi:hypothetical protein